MSDTPPLGRVASDLGRGLAAGEASSVETLYLRHGEAAMRHLEIVFRRRLSREERSECLHEALVVIYENLGEYNPELASPETYLKVRAYGCARKYIRQRDATRKMLLADAQVMASLAVARRQPPDGIEREERDARLYEAISVMPGNHQVVLLAWIRWGPDVYAQKLGEELGKPPELMATWLYRAKQAFRVKHPYLKASIENDN